MPRREKSPFTRKEIALFEALRDPEYENFALAEGQLDGERAIFIGAEGDGGGFKPLALLLSPELIDAVLEENEGGEDLEEYEDGDDRTTRHAPKRFQP